MSYFVGGRLAGNSEQRPLKEKAFDYKDLQLAPEYSNNSPSVVSKKIKCVSHSVPKLDPEHEVLLLKSIWQDFDKAAYETNIEIVEQDVEILAQLLHNKDDSDPVYLAALQVLTLVLCHFLEDYGSMVESLVSPIVEQNATKATKNASQDYCASVNFYFYVKLLLLHGTNSLQISYELDKWTKLLVEVQEPRTTVSIIEGLGVLLGLITDQDTLNTEIEVLLPSLVNFLHQEVGTVKFATSEIVCQCFQQYEFEYDNDADLPIYEKEDILDTFKAWSQERSRVFAQKSLQQAFSLLFKSFEQNFSYNAKQDNNELLMLDSVGLRKATNINIYAWKHLSNLKCLRANLGTNYVDKIRNYKNKYLRQMLYEQRNKKFAEPEEVLGDWLYSHHEMIEVSKMNKIETELAIKKARLAKMEQTM